MLNRRQFFQLGAVAGTALLIRWKLGPDGAPRVWAEPLPGGTLDPSAIQKYVSPLWCSSKSLTDSNW